MKLVKQLSIATSIAIALITINCGIQKSTSVSEFSGTYESVGYGRVLKIENGAFILADLTRFSCIPLLSGEIEDFSKNIYLKNDTLHLEQGINLYQFKRINDAPDICKKGTNAYKSAQAKVNDPEYNFEVLWDTFKEHYAYFELRRIDPDKMYRNYRPRVNAKTTPAQLFFIVNEMLESFDDGHISINAPDDVEKEAMAFATSKGVSENISEKSDTKAPQEKLNNFDIAKTVIDTYLPNAKKNTSGLLYYGILKDNVGYMQMNLMMGYVDVGLSDTLPLKEYFDEYFNLLPEDEDDTPLEVKGINRELDKVMALFANTNAIIIDVRFNGGGKDEVGMNVLKRINGQERIVFSKKGRQKDGFTPTNYVSQPATLNNYKKPVFLLTSGESASATEIMTLSSLSFPQVTRIGSNTEGVFSDVLDKTLPNGWEFGLSNEVYLDMDGKNYEGVGIAPDIEMNYPRDKQQFLQLIQKGLEKNQDPAIEKAIQLSLTN